MKFSGKYEKNRRKHQLHNCNNFENAWHSRWWSILSIAAQRALALSLTEVDSEAIQPFVGFEPKVGEILADVRYEIGPLVSRLPLRG